MLFGGSFCNGLVVMCEGFVVLVVFIVFDLFVFNVVVVIELEVALFVFRDFYDCYCEVGVCCWVVWVDGSVCGVIFYLCC